MALFPLKKKKRRKKKRRPVVKKRPHRRPKKKPAPPPRPAPQPPAQPHPPEPSPGTGSTPSQPASSTALLATARERLFLNRFGTGFTQTALKQLRDLGTTEDWLEAQMNPSSIGEAPKVTEVDAWFAHLWRAPLEKYDTDRAKTKAAWEYGHDLGNWSILRRIYSRRSFLETMTDFWSTNLHIPV